MSTSQSQQPDPQQLFSSALSAMIRASEHTRGRATIQLIGPEWCNPQLIEQICDYFRMYFLPRQVVHKAAYRRPHGQRFGKKRMVGYQITLK